MKTDRFEKALWTIILALSFFLALAQLDMKKEHNEKALKRQLAYKEFLDGGKMPGEWAVAYRSNEKLRIKSEEFNSTLLIHNY